MATPRSLSTQRREQHGYRAPRVVNPACNLQFSEMNVVLEDVGREVYDFVLVQFTARAAGCEVGSGSDNRRPDMTYRCTRFTLCLNTSAERTAILL